MNRLRTIARSILGLMLLIEFFTITPPVFALPSLGEWKSTTQLPYRLASHTMYAFDGKIFVIGGAADNGIPTYLYSHTDISGVTSAWTSLAPVSLFWHATALKNNYFYILGGANHPPTTFSNKVMAGKIQSDGKILNWTTLTPLPEKASMGAAAIIGNMLYFAGGFFNENGTIIINRNIYAAQISDDGSIGNWVQAGSLPQPLYAFGMIAHNDHLIIVGGYNGNTYTTNTFKAPVNADGTITSWQPLSPLPEPAYRSGIIKIGTTLYIIGGTITTTSDKVYSSEIFDDATLGTWMLADHRLPQPVWGGAVTAVNNSIYLTGGYNGSYLDTVYYSKIENDTAQSDILSVPYFSQNALPWGPEEYDHTTQISSQNQTMDRWGCAVTSAAMILRYHGMHAMPDGQQIDPGTLNEWLKSNNGYAYGINKSGWYSGIRWNAISRLSKKLYDAGKSSIKLEFATTDEKASLSATLTDDLTLGNDRGRFPGIIRVFELAGKTGRIGHYVVATGKKEDTYTINDPEWNFPTLASFNNRFDQLIRYIPSHTDLSYIEIEVNPNVEILITNPDGYKTGKVLSNDQTLTYNEIPDARYTFIEPVINPDISGINENLGTGYNEFLLPKPENGKYTITLSSKDYTDYTANIAFSNKNGDSTIKVITGSLGANQHDTVQTEYDPDGTTNIIPAADFKSTIQDITESYELGFISTKGATTSLKGQIENAEKNYATGKKDSMQKNLHTFEKLLTAFKDMSVNTRAFDILLSDVEYLKKNYY